MVDIASIGVTALNAAQMGLLTTEHNIANASTPGYSRQSIVQTANTPVGSSSGFLGQGVEVSTVQRQYNDFITTQLLQQQAQSSQLNTYYTQIQQINNVIADPSAGLSNALQNFFSAVNGVANAPSSMAARQTLLSNAQALTGNFQSLNQLMTNLNTSVNGQITGSIANINSYAQQIASMNQNIALASASNNGQPPNDLLDQRDYLVSQLNQEVKATVIKQNDGSINVYIGNGQSLVMGNQAFTLNTIPSLTDPTKLDVAYQTNGISVRMPSSSLPGGNLGGLIAFRDQSLTQSQNALGRIAIGLGSTFNAQHSLGQDLNGALGGSFFNVASPLVENSSSNTGSGSVSATISNVSSLTGSDYSLSFDGTQYTLTRLSDNTVVSTSTSLPVTADGLTLSISGTPNAGDNFLIRPTVNGAQNISVAISDPSKIAAAVPIRAVSGLNNAGSGSIAAPSVNSPPPPNTALQDTVTLTFTSPTTFNAVDTTTGTTLATNASYTSGSNITFNGWTTNISGSPNTNDTFTISANTNATADGNNALLLAGLQSQNTLINGTASYAGAYAQLVSQVGAQTNQLQVTSQAQTNLVSQTQQTQQSISGVNLDEEAANLIKYQQAYQAAGKAIQTANTMFSTVLNLLN